MKKKLRRIWRQALADKKKFGVFVTTVMVGLLLWGRLIFVEKVPRVATADPSARSAEAAQNRDEQGVGPPLLFKPLPRVRVSLNDQLKRDFFAFHHNHYKPLDKENIGPQHVQNGQDFVDATVRKHELEKLVKGLRLQSVIQGPVPIAVINGMVLRVGDSIEGFEIVALQTRSVQMIQGNQTVTLTMMDNK